ncbi:unnamed protein product [Lathyrus sativus]|nr:unnamed protein product [Lathyrus sativus]
MNDETELVQLCINAACKTTQTVDKWRLQRRSLDRLPSHLADALLRRLITRRLLHPSLLEVFKHSAEEIDLRGDNSVDAEWMAYLGAFRHLRYLNIAECHRINSSALWPTAGMNSLKELDLSRCSKVNDAGINHIISIPNLEKLHISKTSVTAKGIKLLASLKLLSHLDLGGLPVDDEALASLQVLENLQHIELWGSKVSNEGAALLNMFPKLTHLNLDWTSVTKLPNLSTLECLNMSNCTIDSILKDDKSPLTKLIFSGSKFLNEAETLLYANTNSLSFLDLAHTGLDKFFFLSKLKVIEHLNLSSCMIDDDSVEMVASIGGKLKSLNLSGTWVSSAGVGILAGHVPNLEILSLSQTSVDDIAFSFISMMPSLRDVDLSSTNIKGFLNQGSTDLDSLSLTTIQNLKQLERLNLEHTQVINEALFPLSSFQELRYLSLKSPSLADISLYHLSSVPKLTKLSICDAVLTNYALDMFKVPETLKLMDLRGCWLLTKEAIVSFCRNHPQIEVRHELVTVLPFEENGRHHHSSPSRLTSRTMLATRKKEQTSLSPYFVDQRMKYSRDELLALQFMSLPLASSSERDNSM